MDSGYFMVIRPKSDRVRPGYLAWAMNQDLFQAKVNAVSSGTAVPQITKGNLTALEIDVPDVATQERIAAIDSLMQRELKLSNRDVIGDCYEYLIERFAAGAGKKAGEFYTPKEVSILLAKLVDPQPGDTICDPACGSGSLLIRTAKEIHEPNGRPSRNFSLFGQESNGSTWALARMNMFLHEMDSARIEWCDTITNPRLVEDDQLMKFNVVVANPPFSLDKWGAETAGTDHYKRFWRGTPPKSKGDFAFITHMIETSLAGEGRVGVIVPHGVLFRGGSEGLIRQKLVPRERFGVA